LPFFEAQKAYAVKETTTPAVNTKASRTIFPVISKRLLNKNYKKQKLFEEKKQTLSVSTNHTNAEAQAQSEQTQENEIVWVLVLIMIQWDHHCRKYQKRS